MAFSKSFSSIPTIIFISDEPWIIICILIFSLAKALNSFAETPICLIIPLPTTEIKAIPFVTLTLSGLKNVLISDMIESIPPVKYLSEIINDT